MNEYLIDDVKIDGVPICILMGEDGCIHTIEIRLAGISIDVPKELYAHDAVLEAVLHWRAWIKDSALQARLNAERFHHPADCSCKGCIRDRDFIAIEQGMMRT